MPTGRMLTGLSGQVGPTSIAVAVVVGRQRPLIEAVPGGRLKSPGPGTNSPAREARVCLADAAFEAFFSSGQLRTALHQLLLVID